MLGILSSLTGSPFDPLVDKATSEENTSEDWGQIMDICDRVVVESNGAKDCFRSILRRLNSPIPVVIMQALTLTDALISNCGKKFHLEVCSRDFEYELNKLLSNKSQPKVVDRTKQLIKKWAKEFKNDPQLNLMPSLYEKLKSEGVSFKSSEPRRHRSVSDAVLKNPDAVGSAQEEADIVKAIELSLRDSKGGGTTSTKLLGTSPAKQSSNQSSVNNYHQNGYASSSSLYPTFNVSESSNNKSNNSSSNNIKQQQPKEQIKVRALYDFEAAEDNELTFKAGEIILVSDNSDANWWKGSNHRGEGLFPANFVSTDLNAEPERSYKSEKKVQFNEEIKVKVLDNQDQTEGASNGLSAPVAASPTEIDESRVDRLLHLLHEADPQAEKCDSEELLLLEEQCVAMMPLIDQQMESIDKRHAMITVLTQQLNSALNLYHDLMKESLIMDQAAASAVATAYSNMMPNAVPGHLVQQSYHPYHPGMASQIAQPPPYDPQQQSQQTTYNPGVGGISATGTPVSGHQYYQQPIHVPPSPTLGAAYHSSQSYTTLPDGSIVHSGQPQSPSQHQPTSQQQQHTPLGAVTVPGSQIPNGGQIGVSSVPLAAYPGPHHLYQSPTHTPSHTGVATAAASPYAVAPQPVAGNVVQSYHTYQPQIQPEIASSHAIQQQPPQLQIMSTSSPHHQTQQMILVPPGTVTPGGVGVPVPGIHNAVPNLL